MSDTVLLALIASIPPTVASIAALIVSLRNQAGIKKAHETIQTVKEQTNGIQKALLDETAARSDAQGQLQGAAHEQARQAEKLRLLNETEKGGRE